VRLIAAYSLSIGKVFRTRLEQAGGIYVLARSLDDVIPLFGPKKWTLRAGRDIGEIRNLEAA
jgi:hypothetical protein